MPKLQLVLLIHAHQPVGNFDDVLERAYSHCYRPFVELLHRHRSIRLGLHFSGCLLEWIESKHPEFFDRLRALVERGQVELLGGGFYEPILISIPPEDAREQIRRLSEYLEKHFGRRPSGAWLAERVWEPQLPSALAAAGVDYTLVDDNHFLSAGIEASQLHGHYLAEDLGATVKLIPGLKALRYLIPYRSPEDSISFLREVAAMHPSGMAAMGDDCEKFGVWPGTYEHCYKNGWLENFFAAIESNSGWLETATPGDSLAARAPLGRADLPAASYTEMMEWALPTAARLRFQALEREFSTRPDAMQFLRGGVWRNFMAKYPEANLLHKKMLRVSGKIRQWKSHHRRGTPPRALAEATNHLLRAQCNDAYWHGIFGGLYAPHLRTALWRSLVRAETLVDAAAHRRKRYAEWERVDFDADGHEELYLTSDRFAALVAPADGGTVAALDFRPAGVTLINSIARRPEAYHARLGEIAAARAGGSSSVVSIHEQARVKEDGLERWLRYDRWLRHSFRLLVFAPEKTTSDYSELRLDEDAALAGGMYSVVEESAKRVVLVSQESTSPGDSRALVSSSGDWRAEKTFTFPPIADGFEIGCGLSLTRRATPARVQVGLEVVVNLLAPSRPDRYFDSAGARYPLRWSAAARGPELRVVDEWQKAAVALESASAREFWIAPIETVSESEEGFERVYQGSQILAVWTVELSAGATWTGELRLTVSPAG